MLPQTHFLAALVIALLGYKAAIITFPTVIIIALVLVLLSIGGIYGYNYIENKAAQIKIGRYKIYNVLNVTWFDFHYILLVQDLDFKFNYFVLCWQKKDSYIRENLLYSKKFKKIVEGKKYYLDLVELEQDSIPEITFSQIKLGEDFTIKNIDIKGDAKFA